MPEPNDLQVRNQAGGSASPLGLPARPAEELREEAESLYAQARALRQIEPGRSLALAEKSFELATTAEECAALDPAGVAKPLSMIAYFNAVQGDADAALSQAARALGLLGDREPSAVLGDLYDVIAYVRYSRGEIAEAANALHECLEIARVTGDLGLEAAALDSAACINEVTGRPAQAVEGHLEALAIQQDLGDEHNVAVVRNNLAYSYAAADQPERGLECALAALDYLERVDVPFFKVAVLDTVASMYLKTGHPDRAREFALRSLQLAGEHGSWRGEGDALLTLGRVEFACGEYELALEHVTGALAVAEQRGRGIEEYTCHEFLSEIHERRGDLATALEEYKRFHALAHARVNDESATRMDQLEVEHHLETAKKDAEIHRLRTLALERQVEDQRIAQAHLEAQASLDPLTGLYNRRHLSVVEDAMRVVLDRGRPACLVLIDVDRFKDVNDTFGHLSGDRVLSSIAVALARNCRSSDIPCRFGGDEFLMLLSGMDEDAGLRAAERLRAAIEKTTIDSDTGVISVTVSAGVAAIEPPGPGDLSSLIKRADRALYAAKQAGRNQTVVG